MEVQKAKIKLFLCSTLFKGRPCILYLLSQKQFFIFELGFKENSSRTCRCLHLNSKFNGAGRLSPEWVRYLQTKQLEATDEQGGSRISNPQSRWISGSGCFEEPLTHQHVLLSTDYSVRGENFIFTAHFIYLSLSLTHHSYSCHSLIAIMWTQIILSQSNQLLSLRLRIPALDSVQQWELGSRLHPQLSVPQYQSL